MSHDAWLTDWRRRWHNVADELREALAAYRAARGPGTEARVNAAMRAGDALVMELRAKRTELPVIDANELVQRAFL